MASSRATERQTDSTLDEGRDVLFAYIGWSTTYTEDELVFGSHGWLSQNPDDCSEMRAFEAQDGEYWCGIGSGQVASEEMDVVFVAKRPGSRVRSVVGLYRKARPELWNEGDTPNHWHAAVSRIATRFPDHARFGVPGWPGTTGVRRWARDANGVRIPALLEDYRRALTIARAIERGDLEESGEDEELTLYEGELRTLVVMHRARERAMRDAKIHAALRANGGRLRCEVPGCGFDFLEVYGPIGAGYAHVHHKKPLARLPAEGGPTRLRDLAIVCANCHAMLHRGGECRGLADLRVRRRRAG